MQLSHTLPVLSPGIYTIKIVVRDSAGLKSFVFSQLTLASSSPPPPVGSVDVKVAWDPVTINEDDTPITDLKSYELSVFLSGDNSLVTSVLTSSTSFTVQLPVGGTYYALVLAIDFSGNRSAASNQVQIST